MITADELARTWPDRWPRPDPETNRHHRRMVRGFGEDFRDRHPDSIERSEALRWGMENLGKARYVRAMLNDALDEGLITLNVFANMRLAVEEEPIVVPTQADVRAVVKAAPPLLAGAIEVAAYVGVRQGELRALAVEDVDADRRRADINWQITRDGRLKRPKKRSERRVLLPGRAMSRIHERLELAELDSPVRSYRLFPLSRDQLNRLWVAAKLAAGVEIRWHDLRHYCATWMLDHGATTDDVATQLGCDEEQIRRRYGHPDPEKALSRLERLVDG